MESLYSIEMIHPMTEQLERIGFRSLKGVSEIDILMGRTSETTMIMVNSVCDCAAGKARPGVASALQNSVIPDNLATVFAGVDIEATAAARGYMIGREPSSPSIALFANGKLVFMLERWQIESMATEEIAENLIRAFNRFCSMPGPSISPDIYEKVYHVSGQLHK